MHRRTITWHRFFAFALVAMLLLASPAAMMAGNKHKPKDIEGVLPPQAKVLGKTQGQWSAEWWQWVHSQLATDHPLFDGTGHLDFDLPGSSCDHEQPGGKVWFLAGDFGGPANRTCSIPNGRFVFFPIFNFEYDNVTDPPTNFEVPKLTELCLAAVANPRRLEVTLDGRSLKNAIKYAVEPTEFAYTVPDDPDNLYRAAFGLDFDGPSGPAVSCGWYVMLAPLDKGKHKLTIGATNADGSFSLDVAYDLQVGKPKKGKH